MGNSFTASLALLEARLSAARAGYLDNLSGGAVALASVMSATRGGYLDNLSVGAVALDSKMDIVDTNVDTLLTRLTAARAGYLDNLDAPFAQIQEVGITIASSAAVGSTTITAVDLSKTVVYYWGSTSSNTAAMLADDDIAYLGLLNTTTLTASRTGTPATTVVLKALVVEMA